jgi:hypothetical protein
MADAMQGIMALPQAPEQASTPPVDPMAGIDPAALAAFEEARATADPVQVGTELLKEGEKADPATVSELRRTLKSANLPPQILDAIGQMVDAIMAEPEKYQELRAGFLAEGVPEDLLPAQFDAEFFGALNLVLDQMNTGYPQEQAPEAGGIATMPMGAMEPGAPQAFAQGGIAQLKPLAAEMAKMGRNGDSMLAHITPSEARMLRRRGGSGTINPSTGLPEFFLGKIFKSVGNAFKSVGKAIVSGVKSIARGVKKFVNSSVGRVVTAVALGFFLGPAAAGFLGVTSVAGVAAVSGFIGGFGSSMLAGKGIGQSLKMGAIGGIGAGLGAGVLGGAEAFAAGSYAGPTTVAGQWDSLVSGTKNFFGAGTATGTPVNTLDPTVLPTEVGTPLPPAQSFPVSSGGDTISFNPPDLGQQTFSSPPSDIPNFTRPVNVSSTGYGVGMNDPGALGGGGAGDLTPPPVTAAPAPTVAAPTVAPAPTAAAPSGIMTAQEAQNLMQYDILPAGQQTPAAPTSFFEDVTTGAKNLFNKIVPSTPSDAELQRIGLAAYEKTAGAPEFIRQRAYDEAIKEATPGVIRKYAPLAVAGLGIMSLTGGFKAPESVKPGLIPQQTGYDLYKQDPERYGVTVPAATTTYAPASYGNMYTTPLVRRMPAGYMPEQGVRRFAEGGSASEKDYPTDMDEYIPMDGPIDGPGTGTSDSIPAMLSDGEFVFTAKAVRNMGNGSRREGAKRMYALMKQLEEAN